MTSFDVRSGNGGEVTEIIFAEQDFGDYKANVLERYERDGIVIKDRDDGRYVYIENKEHADDLRKALDKAEELGWLK